MKNEILIGCSSYNNRYWKGIFYPDNLAYSKWFEFYSQYFSTYEFNGSFYKFPTLRILMNWYNKAPENFLFSVKAPKEITHIKQFSDCENLISEFYNVCENGLKEKLACVLFQFPPSYYFTSERLKQIISNLDLKFKNVIEFRHKTWWNQEVWDAFMENNITFCSVSHPQLPQTIFKDFPLVYIRLHGVPNMFYSSYSVEELLQIKTTTNLKSGFIYFNNTASEAGILNALEMKRIMI
ncbi:DUF72 domain-containing protein [Flavobacterium sp. WLB]|uniref:DUF72 domain-containing protein n=1 Tax=unclassified Flavobacterium TaxID=196869 RepID=UPI0006AB9650|nr:MULTISPECIES: DUF72 domain-containing protein [unclassified Flavobacterium]KOP38066.1 hypothetical protein AKO67_12245 [Flavobacterium sp. VMW]OWU89074.1 hypothetical protein APR43_17855 [Flavobacterium sp. NLM]PUU67650.1 DUF72 domain-containing protein [Flavobacterium sp. WLB]